MKEITSTIQRGKYLQKVIMTSPTSSKKSINQVTNYLKQAAQKHGLSSLSASQLSSNKSIFVMLQKNLIKPNKFYNYKHKSTSYLSFINPKILDYSVNQSMVWQQCPSYPNIRFLIKRSTHIITQYQKSFRDKITTPQQWKGFEAVLFQHEMSHLKCQNLFDLAEQVQLYQTKQQKVTQQNKLKFQQHFKKFKQLRDSPQNIQLVNIQTNQQNNNNNKPKLVKKVLFKDYHELRNFVQYEIINPV